VRIDLFLHQQGLDTTTPAGKAMFQMMGVFAEFERAIIQERVRAGLKRARSEGKRLGRPPLSTVLVQHIRDALAADSVPFSSLVTGRASRSCSALRIGGRSEIARAVCTPLDVMPRSRKPSIR
jgi:DNA invertase Pin-like site-specific DNA recombinase